jgi:hypothetical protein
MPGKLQLISAFHSSRCYTANRNITPNNLLQLPLKMLTKYRPFYRIFLCLYLLLPALAAAVAIANLASIPSDSQNAVLLGMSKNRLLIAGILAFAAAGFLFLAVQVSRQSEQSIRWLKERLDSTRFLIFSVLISVLLFFTASIFLAIPDKYLGEFWAIEQRLRPLMIWVLLISIQALIGLIGWQARKKTEAVDAFKNAIVPGSISLGIFLLIWLFIGFTHMGVSKENSFWSKVGVPVLWPQIGIALIIAFAFQLLLTHFTKKSNKKIWLDISLCILIWLAAVILWNNQNYVQGVFNTQPRPPTNEIYPINDSLIFDLAAQKMLIGQKMIDDVQDKPIFIAFLAFLHWLAGNSFTNFYLLQIFTYAFIPVLGYFLGKSLHSRALGIMFAILLVIKEKNAIALTNYIHVSTSKMILSEMLTTLGVLLFTLFLIKWLKNPNPTNSNLWLAGGVLGLTSLVRLNAVSILPAAVLVIGLALNFKWKPWVTASVLISVFMMVAAISWVARGVATSGNPIGFISSKTGGVIVSQRYNPLIEQSAPSPSEPNTPTPGTSGVKNYLVIGRGLVTNYLHNLIGITIMLPPSLELYKLLDEVRLPYWKTDWDGSLLPGAFWIILGVLALVALGIASAWRRWRAAGLVPLVVILGYNITAAISLTSGGRYLVPMDWCVLLYFSIGLFDATQWLLTLFGWHLGNQELNLEPIIAQPKKNSFSTLAAGLIFLFLGAFPILMETLPAQRYPDSLNINDFIEANQSIPELSAQNATDNIVSLSKDPLAKNYYGRALYPRYFGENKGDSDNFEVLPLIGSTSYDHLSFYLISNAGDAPVILPTSERISPSLAGSDTWVLGCQREHYFEAMLVVFRAGDVTRVYQQEPFKTSCQ